MFQSISRARESVASGAAVALHDVRKVYGRGDGTVVALDGVSIQLAAGSFTAVMGPSGARARTPRSPPGCWGPPLSQPKPPKKG